MASRTLEPLAGRRIIVTRPRHQAASLSAPLTRLGAEAIEAPVIRIEPPEDFGPLDRAIADLDGYDWVLFTSANGVDAFFSRGPRSSRPSFAAIGPSTAAALAARGVSADVVPDRFVAEAVFEALRVRTDVARKRFLLPRADIAREALPRLLRKAGAEVDVVTAYRTVTQVAEVARAAELVRRGTIDAVTFTSGSTVRSFFTQADDTLRSACVAASIGPITSAALREQRVEPAIEAAAYTTAGLADAIRHYFDTEDESA